ncbi:UPF0481 protein At3g47200 isoform X2 [Ricinus communis]|nr:UPF0481 protein At3g47200 isoform X2 [Ricinus communis]
MTRDAFAEMLIIDGCFIIELFRRFVCIVQKDDDPLFKMPWVRKVLVTDLLLLENQLPWFVLNRLFELSDTYDSEGRSLNQLAENFFHHSALRPGWIRVNSGLQNKHLLDLQRNIILLKSNESVDGGILPIPCVTELLLAGIDFAVGETDDLMKITFKNGVLTIPPVKVLDNAESLLRNLIAYEQCDKNLENRITAYAAFLDNLINSKEDLEYLHQKKIITYYLSSEDVSAFFDGLYNEVHVERSLYTEVSKDINAYCRSHWPRWRIRLTRDYFNNPWSIISLIGAIMILVLTFLQTLYAILYH